MSRAYTGMQPHPSPGGGVFTLGANPPPNPTSGVVICLLKTKQNKNPEPEVRASAPHTPPPPPPPPPPTTTTTTTTTSTSPTSRVYHFRYANYSAFGRISFSLYIVSDKYSCGMAWGGGGWSLNSFINATFKISYIFGKNENSILNRARKKKNIIKGGKCNKSSSDDVIDRRMTSAQGERDVTRRQLPAASTTRNGISKMFTLGPKNKKQKQKTIN